MLIIAQAKGHKSDVHWEITTPVVKYAVGKFGRLPVEACDVYHGTRPVSLNRTFYIHCHNIAYAQRKTIWSFRFVLVEADGTPTRADATAQYGHCMYHCEPIYVVPRGQDPPLTTREVPSGVLANMYEMYKRVHHVDSRVDKLFLSNQHLMDATTIIYNQSLLQDESDQKAEVLRIYRERIPSGVDMETFAHIFGFREPYTVTYASWFSIPAQVMSVYTPCLGVNGELMHVLFDVEYQWSNHIDSSYYRALGSHRVQKLYDNMFKRLRACADLLHLTKVIMPPSSYVEDFGNEWRSAFHEHMDDLVVQFVGESPLEGTLPSHTQLPHLSGVLLVVNTHPDEPFQLDSTTATLNTCGLINPDVKIIPI